MGAEGIHWRSGSPNANRQPLGPRMGGVKSFLDPRGRKACHGCTDECVALSVIMCGPCWEAVPVNLRAILVNRNPPAEKNWGRWEKAIKASRKARGSRWKKRGISHGQGTKERRAEDD